jgi:hypothetical protein
MRRLFDHLAALLVATGSVLLILLVSSSGPPVGQVSPAEVHHYAHIALPVIAFVIFSGGVLMNVRRNGWPAFSWHL